MMAWFAFGIGLLLGLAVGIFTFGMIQIIAERSQHKETMEGLSR